MSWTRSGGQYGKGCCFRFSSLGYRCSAFFQQPSSRRSGFALFSILNVVTFRNPLARRKGFVFGTEKSPVESQHFRILPVVSGCCPAGMSSISVNGYLSTPSMLEKAPIRSFVHHQKLKSFHRDHLFLLYMALPVTFCGYKTRQVACRFSIKLQ
ncbi:hypothetical protein SAMN05192553_105118 [Cyclobacterium xiamenense]|uniref:Uncharacterized protein n=1 Tax=Cyclobacterium xiamenense TaxID=1297121 RepID=A0A1H6ZV22_9BACT|nr:hypothetical protein SAMN05192553_105118 [Cyclobacterium xiamenense]